MSEPQTEQDLHVSIIRGLLKAVLLRKQIHGSGGLEYDDFTEETRLISEARAVIAEKERMESIPMNPWDPRWRKEVP